MTTTDLPAIPDGVDVHATIRHVTDHAPRAFLWDYERSRPQLVTLYNKAMASQWSSVTDLDWSVDVDPERLIDWESPMMVLAPRRAKSRDRRSRRGASASSRRWASSRSRLRSASSCTASRAPC